MTKFEEKMMLGLISLAFGVGVASADVTDVATSNAGDIVCLREKSYCVGDRVINDNSPGLIGTIGGIYADGQSVAVKYDGDDSYYKWPVAQLALTKGCQAGYCVCDKVINDNSPGLIGTIGGIYADGISVAVKYDGDDSYYKWPVAKLARTGDSSCN